MRELAIFEGAELRQPGAMLAMKGAPSRIQIQFEGFGDVHLFHRSTGANEELLSARPGARFVLPDLEPDVYPAYAFDPREDGHVYCLSNIASRDWDRLQHIDLIDATRDGTLARVAPCAGPTTPSATCSPWP